jgi:hypothetical protein
MRQETADIALVTFRFYSQFSALAARGRTVDYVACGQADVSSLIILGHHS